MAVSMEKFGVRPVDHGLGDVRVVFSKYTQPGKVYIINRTLFVPKPSEIRTQVWNDLHARLPWIQGGDDPLTRMVVGVKVHSKDHGRE